MTKKKMGGTVESFRKKVREIIGWFTTGDSEEFIRPEQRLVRDLGADDLALVEILIDFEDQFEIEIPDGDLFAQGEVGEETVQDVYDYFDKRIEFEM